MCYALNCQSQDNVHCQLGFILSSQIRSLTSDECKHKHEVHFPDLLFRDFFLICDFVTSNEGICHTIILLLRD